MKRIIPLAAVAGVTIMLVSAIPASARNDVIGPASVRKSTWVHYTTQRTVSESGTNIYVRKSNGPELDVTWRRCAGGQTGTPVRLPNTDPTSAIRIGRDFLAGTVFCLSAYSRGNNETDTWEGIIYWDVRQAP
ncbi:hypothetical protein ACIOGX_21945 [Streptomyces sp. NPDC088147]|uniref:hypothetical protein n=1 Tax=unclassified Streptomyces TaxID=2593676 RepID=UPI00381D456B